MTVIYGGFMNDGELFDEWWNQLDIEDGTWEECLACHEVLDISDANGDTQQEANIRLAAGWEGAEHIWYCPKCKLEYFARR